MQSMLLSKQLDWHFKDVRMQFQNKKKHSLTSQTVLLTFVF